MAETDRRYLEERESRITINQENFLRYSSIALKRNMSLSSLVNDILQKIESIQVEELITFKSGASSAPDRPRKSARIIVKRRNSW